MESQGNSQKDQGAIVILARHTAGKLQCEDNLGILPKKSGELGDLINGGNYAKGSTDE